MNLELEYDVDGIPVYIELYFEVGEPARMSGHPDYWTPGSGSMVEIEKAEVVDIEHLIEYICDEVEDDGPFTLELGPFTVSGEKIDGVISIASHSVRVNEDALATYIEENMMYDDYDPYDDYYDR